MAKRPDPLCKEKSQTELSRGNPRRCFGILTYGPYYAASSIPIGPPITATTKPYGQWFNPLILPSSGYGVRPISVDSTTMCRSKSSLFGSLSPGSLIRRSAADTCVRYFEPSRGHDSCECRSHPLRLLLNRCPPHARILQCAAGWLEDVHPT